MSVEDQRNKQGLAHLRSRYVKRAKFLIADTEFRAFVEEERSNWNQRVRQYQIEPAVPGKEISPTNPYGLFAPAGLWEDHVEAMRVKGPVNGIPFSYLYHAWGAWEETLKWRFPERYFPERYYFNPGTQIMHPASTFLSACFIHYPELLDRHIESLFPVFKLEPIPRIEQLDDRGNWATAQGERDYLLEVLERLLAEKPDELQQIKDGLFDAGQNRFAKELPGGIYPTLSILDDDPRPHEWYVPIIPLLSTSDVEDVKGAMVEMSLRVFGAEPINDHIRELKKLNPLLSNQRIANLLGITKTTVDAALKGGN